MVDYEHNVVTVTRQELFHLGEWMKKNDVRHVLEFGSGISSHFLGTLACCISFESEPTYKDATRRLVDKYGPSNYTVHPWDGTPDVPKWVYSEPWDMVFIDGPADSAYGHYGRRGAFEVAGKLLEKNLCPYVWAHDAWEHQVIDYAVRFLAPHARLLDYPEWNSPNKFFTGASMILFGGIE